MLGVEGIAKATSSQPDGVRMVRESGGGVELNLL